MKRLFAVILLIALMACTLVIPAAAATFEWPMEVGDDLSLSASDTPYVSSDTSVVEIRHDGGTHYTAIAVGPGTATLTGATWMGAKSQDYLITVKDPAANSQPSLNPSQLMQEPDTNGLFKKVFSISPGFTLFFVAVSLFIACLFVLIFASIGKARKLDTAMANIQANPCQETADAAVKEFTKINKFVKMNLSMGGDNRGTHFTMWRKTFNHVVVPCNKITPETKNALRLALISMTTHGLREVIDTHHADVCSCCGNHMDADADFCTKCGKKR